MSETDIRREPEESAPVCGVSDTTPGSQSYTILLAEDEYESRVVTSTILRGAGFDVIPVRDGAEAVQTFMTAANQVNLLLFDLIMPNKNGWRAYLEISLIRPGIPHLFMSGFMGYTLQQAPPDNDLEGVVIRKPFTQERLLYMVEYLLRRSVWPPSPEEYQAARE